MRLVFGMISLLLVLAFVGLLVKKQLGVVTVSQNPALAGQAVTAPDGLAETKNSPLNSQQIQQQVRQSLEAAMQRPRTVDGE